MTASNWIAHDSDSDQIILSASSEFLFELTRIFAGLESQDAQPVELTQLPKLEVRGQIRLLLDPPTRRDGLRQDNENGLSWRLTYGEEGWLEASEKIESVAASERPCHCYLDTIGRNDVEFVISKDELKNLSADSC